MGQGRVDGEEGPDGLLQRRHRANPRVVKRKVSKFMKERPQHRNIPRLRKRFTETVVVESP
jgi:hypothetical protein